MFISEEDIKDPVDFEDLKGELSDALWNLTDDLDDETLQKINDLKEDIQEKYSNTAVEEKLDDIKMSYYEKLKRSFEKDMDVDPGRILGLTDGIFGMVMTLLVFGIALPEIVISSSADFASFLQSITPTIGITLVSFILVSSFWLYHHEFMKITNLNIPYLWLSIFYLASISFIPFSTSVVGNYSQFFLANAVLGINILLTIIFFLLMFRYASNRGFLENKPSDSEKKYIYNTFYIIMGLTILINLLDFNISNNFIYLYFLVPVISTLRDINFKMDS
ncbi:TMEM175 family protein [uncultured Methanobrevibacter sp.]|uniref:TMEM175 family protein n=1 Tax=uncultured Methanobrevibacter sp. TaxID=253161 RepID=UPI002589EF69|nr:TMEM175 family protein [uncultured Methanobrevibacter sp.]